MKKNIFYKAVGEVKPHLLDKFEQMEQSSNIIKPMKWLMPMIASFLCMSVTAYAVGLFDLPINISSFLGINDKNQVKYLAKGSSLVDNVIEGENGSIHIKEVMGDNNYVYIFFDFIATEGVILNKNYYEFLMKNAIIEEIEQIYWVYQLEDEDKTDNKLSFVYSIQTEKSLQNEEISLELSGLYGYDDKDYSSNNRDLFRFNLEEYKFELNDKNIKENYPEIIDCLVLYDGTWKSEPFKLDFKDNSNNYKINKWVTSNGVEFKLEVLSISPFAVTFSGKVNDKSENYVEFKKNANKWDLHQIIVHYDDETTEIVSGSGGVNYKEFIYTCNFLPVISNEIVAVTYLGEKIYLND